MYLTVKAVQSYATLIYIIAGIASLLIAMDFFLMRDGLLRKILIGLFLSWALHYLGASYLFFINAPRAVLIGCGAIFTCIDFVMLISLYAYFKHQKWSL